MKSIRQRALAASAVVTAALVLASPSALAAPHQAHGSPKDDASAQGSSRPADAASHTFNARVTGPRAGTTSPYVEASSPAEAMKILNALQSPQTASPSAKAAAGEVKYGPCVLYPTVIYLRTSGGGNTLGAKPYTKCSVPVTSIHHDTQLRYQWLWFWWRKADSYSGGNTGEANYTQRKVEWTCQGKDSTTWAGSTLGTIVYKGETYYALVYQTPVTKDCGA